MSEPVKKPIYTVYLLHFDQPLGRSLHYLGICKSYRLHWRMLDHLNGRGAALTSKAVERNIGWEIVYVWRCDDPRKERDLKRTGNFKAWCWKCSPLERVELVGVHKTHYQPRQEAASFKPLDGLTGSRFSRYQK